MADEKLTRYRAYRIEEGPCRPYPHEKGEWVLIDDHQHVARERTRLRERVRELERDLLNHDRNVTGPALERAERAEAKLETARQLTLIFGECVDDPKSLRRRFGDLRALLDPEEPSGE